MTQKLDQMSLFCELNISKKCRVAVLLATVRVIVEAPDARRVYARALFHHWV